MGMCCETRRPRHQRRWTSVTCMDASFLLLTRAGHPRRESFVMGLTKDALRPRSDAGRGRRSGGAKRRSSARGDSSGNRLRGSCYEGSGWPTTSSQTSAWERDAARPEPAPYLIRGRTTSVGERREVKRPAHDVTAGRRMTEDAVRPRVNNVSGRTARREAACLLATADRRMSKLRPGCVSAMPQA